MSRDERGQLKSFIEELNQILNKFEKARDGLRASKNAGTRSAMKPDVTVNLLLELQVK